MGAAAPLCAAIVPTIVSALLAAGAADDSRSAARPSATRSRRRTPGQTCASCRTARRRLQPVALLEAIIAAGDADILFGATARRIGE
jgi:hypothetical protein